MADNLYTIPWSPKLEMWAMDALKECNFNTEADRSIALFPQWWLKKINTLPNQKTIDYNFVGALQVDKKTYNNRRWILDFAKEKFTEDSLLQFTDRETKRNYSPLGIYDQTMKNQGFVPKEHPVIRRNYFDWNYYKILSKSKFTLCPAGDTNWSMRFYEAIACKSIPVLPDQYSFRTSEEAELGYFFYTKASTMEYSEKTTMENFRLFMDQQTFSTSLDP